MSKYNITPFERFPEWEKIITETREGGKDVYIVSDTETTGGTSSPGKTNSVFEKVDPKCRGKRHRILEIGAIFCTKNDKGEFEPIKDSNNENIFFHEYINPFDEPEEKKKKINSIDYIPEGAFYVHGISKKSLYAKEKVSGEIMLKDKAPCMQDIVLDFIKLSTVEKDLEGSVFGVFHNVPFDFTFLDSEFECCENEFGEPVQRFQDMFVPYDTINFFESVISKDEVNELKEKAGIKKGRYGLDTLRGIFSNLGYIDESLDRSFHGAYKDSLILIEIYNGVQNYLADKERATKKISFNKKKDFSEYSVPSFSLGESDDSLKNNRRFKKN